MLAEIDTVNRNHMDRLVNRRDRIMARIRTIDNQIRQLEQNSLVYDEKSMQQRKKVLVYLSNFHHTEVDQVDNAINRMATAEYGCCLGCNGQIQADWLESFPEAEFCSICSRIRERMAAG
jgi:RNA polymerase-binding transcription factor DksA